MKIKAVIMRPDRTNNIVKLKRKQIQNKGFTYNEKQYFLDPDRFVLTWDRSRLVRTYYTTYYFKEGVAKPLPVPDFPVGKNGDFSGIVDNGVSPSELAAIFNPWLYRTITPRKKDLFEVLQFYMLVGISLGMVYVVYLLSRIPVV